MKLKTVEIDGKLYAIVQDGKPVYSYDDGKEVGFDAPGTSATISRLNAEAKGHREAKEAAESSLKAFEGIGDPAVAKKALETVRNLDDKRLVDAGEIEKVRAEAIKAVEDKYTPVTRELDFLRAEITNEKIGGSFARSKFISENLAIPSDLVQARFGNQFKLDNGKVVAHDNNGNPIYSRSRPGEIADFDEALNIIVDSYQYRDTILKASGATGGGSTGGTSTSGTRTVSRSAFATMAPQEQATFAKAVRDGTATLSD